MSNIKHLKTPSQNYIAASIHRNFYFNEDLGAPTLIKEYEKIEQLLTESKFVACVTIQVPQLHKIEYEYGSGIYNDLLAKTTALVKALKEKEFREQDIFTVDLFDVDTFIIFLSAPRKPETQLLDHLEPIAERARIYLDQAVFHIFHPFTKDYARPSVGYALVIKNPMINNIRLIMQLVSNAKKMGEFTATKHHYQSNYNLQKIIIEQKIQTVFQPIIALDTLDIIGYEALSRGPKDTEFTSPLMLFTLASEYGLSFELDTLCRKKAFERARNLDSHIKIFINTLTMTIHDPQFRGLYLEELMQDLKIKPENVVFEVNEKLAIDNYDVFRRALKDYSDIGIVHASDDIGSGFSDLERIMELQPGYMKLDIALIRDIHKSYIKREIVRSMTTLAISIGSHVIAEGVETTEEYRTLKEIGVHYGQGYLFGRPADALEPVNPEFLASIAAAP